MLDRNQSMKLNALKEKILGMEQKSPEVINKCLPIRQSIPEVEEMSRMLYILNLKQSFIDNFDTNLTLDEFLSDADINRNPDMPEMMDKDMFSPIYYVAGFKRDSGSVFSLRHDMLKRFEDMKIGDEVPMEFVRLPFPKVYLEISPPEFRGTTDYFIYNNQNKQILEGAYLFESRLDKLRGSSVKAGLSERFVKFLDLDIDKPTRVINIAFTGSPTSATGSPLLMQDQMDFFSLYVQDENESAEKLLARHMDYFKLKYQDKFYTEEFYDFQFKNFQLIIKSLLYINSEHHEFEKDNSFSNYQSKLKGLKNKKKIRRLEKEFSNSYDRILVGPGAPYKSLTDLNKQLLRKNKIKKAFFRRGYFGIRLVGEGRKKRSLRWIKPTIVNKELLSELGVDIKIYDVF